MMNQSVVIVRHVLILGCTHLWAAGYTVHITSGPGEGRKKKTEITLPVF